MIEKKLFSKQADIEEFGYRIQMDIATLFRSICFLSAERSVRKLNAIETIAKINNICIINNSIVRVVWNKSLQANVRCK